MHAVVNASTTELRSGKQYATFVLIIIIIHRPRVCTVHTTQVFAQASGQSSQPRPFRGRPTSTCTCATLIQVVSTYEHNGSGGSVPDQVLPHQSYDQSIAIHSTRGFCPPEGLIHPLPHQPSLIPHTKGRTIEAYRLLRRYGHAIIRSV